MFSPTDTIVAIATPPGRGGLGVVRISGASALRIASELVQAAEPLRPRHATLVRVADALGHAIDSVIATYFEGPHSYTGDDAVELSAHGSPVVLREILRAAIRAGARLATPGEFTLRAFLNGRIDLVQAEAIGDLVDAGTSAQARAAFDQLNGTLTAAIGRLDAQLMEVVARLEASLDFPEEGFHFVSAVAAGEALRDVRSGLEALLADAGRGRLIREGLPIGIFGKSNVGKSSLFNYLVGAERAIVTEVPGTTRDWITESVEFEGLRLVLIDTAGIRMTDDVVEQEGVRRSREALVHTVVSILILDRSVPLEPVDRELLAAAGRATSLVVVNKCDLAPAWDTDELGLERRPACVSLLTSDGLPALRQALLDALGVADIGHEVPMVTNLRHETLLREARDAVLRAEERLADAGTRWSEEFVLADLQGARSALEEVTGKRTSEDLLRHIFERYCVGK